MRGPTCEMLDDLINETTTRTKRGPVAGTLTQVLHTNSIHSHSFQNCCHCVRQLISFPVFGKFFAANGLQVKNGMCV